jgi:hypothetical protein
MIDAIAATRLVARRRNELLDLPASLVQRDELAHFKRLERSRQIRAIEISSHGHVPFLGLAVVRAGRKLSPFARLAKS